MPDWQRLRGKFLVLDGGEGCGKSTQTRLLAQFLQDQRLPLLVTRDPGSTAIGEKIRAVLLDPANDAMAMRCEMLLYMAARAQMMAEIIRPALARGEVVLCDRFISSTLAYQLGGDGLTWEEIMAVGEVAVGGRAESDEATKRAESDEATKRAESDEATKRRSDEGAETEGPIAQSGVAPGSGPSSLRRSVASSLLPDLTLLLDMPVEASQARVTAKYVPLFAGAGELPDPSKDRIEQRPLSYHRQVRDNYLAQARALPDRYAVIRADRPEQEVFQDVLAAVGRVVN